MYDNVDEELYRGCAMDSAVTLEICNAQDNVLKGGPLVHYRKMLELQKPFMYMQLRGIRYDAAGAAKMLAETNTKLDPIGAALCEEAHTELRGPKKSLSAKRLQTVLYIVKKYPPQFKKEEGKSSINSQPTSKQF